MWDYTGSVGLVGVPICIHVGLFMEMNSLPWPDMKLDISVDLETGTFLNLAPMQPVCGTL